MRKWCFWDIRKRGGWEKSGVLWHQHTKNLGKKAISKGEVSEMEHTIQWRKRQLGKRLEKSSGRVYSKRNYCGGKNPKGTYVREGGSHRGCGVIFSPTHNDLGERGKREKTGDHSELKGIGRMKSDMKGEERQKGSEQKVYTSGGNEFPRKPLQKVEENTRKKSTKTTSERCRTRGKWEVRNPDGSGGGGAAEKKKSERNSAHMLFDGTRCRAQFHAESKKTEGSGGGGKKICQN